MLAHRQDASSPTRARSPPPTGAVSLTSNVKTNITSNADSSSAGSGAGIAVAVLITSSEAFVDSTAATPVTAQSLTIAADTDNTAPTTAKSSSKGTTENDASANDPSRANGNSQTSDGNQDVTAALAVTVLVATTQAYISPSNAKPIALSTGAGAQTIHAGASNKTSAIADAGNVKFSPGRADADRLRRRLARRQHDLLLQGDRGARLRREPRQPRGAARDPDAAPANKTINLSWTAVPGATGYKVYRSTATGEEKLLTTLGAVTELRRRRQPHARHGRAADDEPDLGRRHRGRGQRRRRDDEGARLEERHPDRQRRHPRGDARLRRRRRPRRSRPPARAAAASAWPARSRSTSSSPRRSPRSRAPTRSRSTATSRSPPRPTSTTRRSRSRSSRRTAARAGVGASFALNVVNDTTTAGIAGRHRGQRRPGPDDHRDTRPTR